MKFRGELKFPEIDHPGVPVTFLIEGSQAELVLEGESLGRWSLYDVHARRLVANAFQIDLEGTEVTFVADDPIDFAYRGVEHMAETWAALKAKRIATRSIAVRKSRKGTVPSRIEDMKAAMESNLQAQSASRQIAGEPSMPDTAEGQHEEVSEPAAQWDRRDEEAAIPLVGSDSSERPDVAVPGPASTDESAPASDVERSLEEERRRLAEERARFEEERRIAEQREADRIEAYRLEMKRLEEEREELRRQAAEMSGQSVTAEPEPDEEVTVSRPEPASPVTQAEPEPVAEAESEPVAEAEPEPEPEQEPETEPEAEPEPEPEAEPEPEPAGPGVVDLKDLEERVGPSLGQDAPPPAAASPSRVSRPAPQKEPEPAMAGASKDKGGLMGAVRAAFRSSARDHEHQFIEAPGGIGITRYVCEECGYVSISV